MAWSSIKRSSFHSNTKTNFYSLTGKFRKNRESNLYKYIASIYMSYIRVSGSTTIIYRR